LLLGITEEKSKMPIRGGNRMKKSAKKPVKKAKKTAAKKARKTTKAKAKKR